MNNFTLSQKQQLQALYQDGYTIVYLTYNPTVNGTAPENQFSAFDVFYRENTGALNEVIFTHGATGGPPMQLDFSNFNNSGALATIMTF